MEQLTETQKLAVVAALARAMGDVPEELKTGVLVRAAVELGHLRPPTARGAVKVTESTTVPGRIDLSVPYPTDDEQLAAAVVEMVSAALAKTRS